jgi:hypothetical protein
LNPSDNNSIAGIFTDYIDGIKDNYVIDGVVGEERNAFCAGLIMGLTLAGVDPDEIESVVSTKSLGEDLDELLIRKDSLP